MDKTIKIFLAGSPRSGKTSFCDAFQDQSAEFLYFPTIGIDIRIQRASIDYGRVKLYDTAGHERFRKVILTYVNDTDIILLFVDLTNSKSIDEAKDIYRDIVDHSEWHIPIALIATKKDLTKKRTVSQDTIRKLGKDIGAVFVKEIDCKTRRGIMWVKQYISEMKILNNYSIETEFLLNKYKSRRWWCC